MKNAASHRIVLVTAPDLKTARGLAQAALDQRLVACANLVPQIESHYRWQGKLERSKEVLLLFKAHQRTLERLEQLLLEIHPYDTPEIVSLKPEAATLKYLNWWGDSVR